MGPSMPLAKQQRRSLPLAQPGKHVVDLIRTGLGRVQFDFGHSWPSAKLI